MPELEPIVAVPAVRIPRQTEDRIEATVRFAPLSGILSGPIFTRTRDIIAANMTELLDRSEDPARMIRMIINEMEETLVDVRATAARSIADIKEMRRACIRLDDLQHGWTEKAGLALEKGREDLARAALGEKQKAAEMAEGLHTEVSQIEQVLRGYEADIHRLQIKLAEARARQNAIASRFEGLLRFVALQLGRQLGTEVVPALSRKDLADPAFVASKGREAFRQVVGQAGPGGDFEDVVVEDTDRRGVCAQGASRFVDDHAEQVRSVVRRGKPSGDPEDRVEPLGELRLEGPTIRRDTARSDRVGGRARGAVAVGSGEAADERARTRGRRALGVGGVGRRPVRDRLVDIDDRPRAHEWMVSPREPSAVPPSVPDGLGPWSRAGPSDPPFR